MPKQRRRTAEKYDPNLAHPGGFRVNGSWDDNGQAGTPLYQLVKELRRLRRTTMATPAELIRGIPAPLLQAFPCASWWETLTKVHPCMPAGEWGSVQPYTSAEAAVVYAFKRNDGYPLDAPKASEDGIVPWLNPNLVAFPPLEP